MRLESLHLGMTVRHPHYGSGTVKAISELSAEVRFGEVTRTVEPVASGLTAAEPQAALSALEVPLTQLLEQTIEQVVTRLGWENPDTVVAELANRWHGGRLVLHPADPASAAKELPVEVFFHKIVGMRNQLRVLEQKINAHPQLSDAEKIELQQYVSRCYGSMTTFNLLFKTKEGQFASKGE